MKKVLLTTIFIILLGFFINPQVMLAVCQCPTNIPPTNLQWTQQGPVYITIMDDAGRPCTFKVWYCWRQYVDQISPAPFIAVWPCEWIKYTPCDPFFSLGYFETSKRLSEGIIQANPDNLDWPAPDCPYVNDHYLTYVFGCIDGNDLPCGVAVYCRFRYEICNDNGVRRVTLVGQDKIGDDCPSGCDSGC